MNINIAKNLERLRKDNGYTQEALAEKVGVSRQAVSSWEQGNASPDTDNLIALAKIYGVKVDDLLVDTDRQAEFEAERDDFFGVGIGDKSEKSKKNKSRAAAFPFPVLVVMVYFVVGFTTHAWHPAWLLFFTIPLYYYIINWVEQANGNANRHWMELFPYPLVVAAVYLVLGFVFHIWHPTWLLFLTIPIYYFIQKIVTEKEKGLYAMLSAIYPIIAVCVFLLLGFLVPGAWNWAWLVFLTIPLWSWMLKNKKENKDEQ